MYEIRVYYTRYNMDPDYYGGTKGIWRRWKAKTPEELIRKWKKHVEEYTGDTYSVWDLNSGDMIIGGAYDLGDVDYIEEYFKEETYDEEKRNEAYGTCGNCQRHGDR